MIALGPAFVAIMNRSAAGDVPEALNSLYRRLLMLPEQASTVARRIDTLHYFEITVMLAVAALIAAFVVYCLVRFRRRHAHETTPSVTAPLWFELTAYPAMLLFFLALWVVGFRQYAVLASPPADALDVYVVAKQWMWKFSYADGPASVGTLVVPAGTPVRLLLTSRDVVHSFFVPAFRVKRDAVPGLYTTAWFEAPEPGRHRVFCAEMCGTGHSRMWGEVVVLAPGQFERWLDSGAAGEPGRDGTGVPVGDRLPAGRMARLGAQAAAEHGCLRCHTTDGRPHLGPTWRGLFGSAEPLASGGRIVVDESYLTRSMMDPLAEVVAGWEPIMPSYQGQLDAASAAAIVEYIKWLSGPGPDAAAHPLPAAGATLVPGRDGTLPVGEAPR